MSAIYILTDHGKLSKKDETIVYTQLDGTKTIIFPFKTEQLVLLGSVSISGEAFNLFSKYKIPVIFLAKNGKFNGKLTFGDSKNVFLRQKQYEILSSANKSLEIARSIVVGKIRNQISFMQRIKRKNSNSCQEKIFLSNLTSIKNVLIDSGKTDSIEKLRGYEGLAARCYFATFNLNIIPDWAEFKTRSRNPPKTNVNAVLSFLYTLLMYRVESALESQGLDICCGNLHSLNYGKTALVYDLMEEFRVPVADSLCCSLFNLNILKENDFKYEVVDENNGISFFNTDNSDESSDIELVSYNEKAVLLTKEGIKKVISAFEQKLDTLIMYEPSGEKISYKKIIYEQAIHYKRVILGEESKYNPYYLK